MTTPTSNSPETPQRRPRLPLIGLILSVVTFFLIVVPYVGAFIALPCAIIGVSLCIYSLVRGYKRALPIIGTLANALLIFLALGMMIGTLTGQIDWSEETTSSSSEARLPKATPPAVPKPTLEFYDRTKGMFCNGVQIAQEAGFESPIVTNALFRGNMNWTYAKYVVHECWKGDARLPNTKEVSVCEKVAILRKEVNQAFMTNLFASQAMSPEQIRRTVQDCINTN